MTPAVKRTITTKNTAILFGDKFENLPCGVSCREGEGESDSEGTSMYLLYIEYLCICNYLNRVAFKAID